MLKSSFCRLLLFPLMSLARGVRTIHNTGLESDQHIGTLRPTPRPGDEYQFSARFCRGFANSFCFKDNN